MASYIAANGDTWDTISYKAYRDEMLFPNIIEANESLQDVVVFDGGERVEIPENVVVDNAVIASPFEKGATISIISAPW